jgi:hypothetical protein
MGSNILLLALLRPWMTALACLCVQLEDDLHTERQRSTSHSHKLTDENKRLQTQCVELQRDLDAAQKEFTRLKASCIRACFLECLEKSAPS